MEHIEKKLILKTLAEFGHCDITVGGESMKPFIRPGDRVRLLRSIRKPRPGDVVGFFNGNQLIIHRVIGRKTATDGNWQFSVWGDSSCDSIGTVHSSDIIGVVSFLRRKNKKRALWFKVPFNLLTVPFGLLFQTWVRWKHRFFYLEK
jgi:signal peptidase I